MAAQAMTRHARGLRATLAAALCAGLLAAAGGASAQSGEHWALDRFAAQGVDGATTATFQQLLHGQIASRTQGQLTDLGSGCQDSTCVRAGAARVGARVAVYGTLGRLGQKVVVTATAVDVNSARTLRSESASVDRVEDLDDVADRLAEAL